MHLILAPIYRLQIYGPCLSYLVGLRSESEQHNECCYVTSTGLMAVGLLFISESRRQGSVTVKTSHLDTFSLIIEASNNQVFGLHWHFMYVCFCWNMFSIMLLKTHVHVWNTDFIFWHAVDYTMWDICILGRSIEQIIYTAPPTWFQYTRAYRHVSLYAVRYSTVIESGNHCIHGDMCVFGTNFINVPYKGSITRYYTCM